MAAILLVCSVNKLSEPILLSDTTCQIDNCGCPLFLPFSSFVRSCKRLPVALALDYARSDDSFSAAFYGEPISWF